MTDSFQADKGKIPCHYGPFRDSFVYLPVCESGGICLEWYKDHFIKDMTFRQLDEAASRRQTDENLIFLPYVNGVNAPEFDKNASGVFYGLSVKHDAVSLGAAVMEGVAFLLDKNIHALGELGIYPSEILSSGGGAKSDYWNQLKADITGIPVAIPTNEEAALCGAAIIGAVTSGYLDDYEQSKELITIGKVLYPHENERLCRKKQLFDRIYGRLFIGGERVPV